MAERKTIIFEKYEDFEKEYNSGNLGEYSCIAIKETRQLWSNTGGGSIGDVLCMGESNTPRWVDAKELFDKGDYYTKEEIDEKVNYSYSIDFIKGTLVQEYNTGEEFVIDSINLINISSVTLQVGAEKKDLAKGLVIPKNALLTWEISKTNNELPAAIGIVYKYNKNED